MVWSIEGSDTHEPSRYTPFRARIGGFIFSRDARGAGRRRRKLLPVSRSLSSAKKWNLAKGNKSGRRLIDWRFCAALLRARAAKVAAAAAGSAICCSGC